MKVEFVKKYEVKGPKDGIPDSPAVEQERKKRGMLPRGISAIYRKGDIVEFESEASALHFIKRGVAIEADSKAKAKTPEQIRKEVSAEITAKRGIADGMSQK